MRLKQMYLCLYPSSFKATNVVSLNPTDGDWRGVLDTTLCDKVCQ